MREREKRCRHKNGRFACQLSVQWCSSSLTYTARGVASKARWDTNYLIKFDFSYHRQLAKPCLIVAYMLRYSFVHAPINWQWSREGRVKITVWVVSVRVSVSCALKRKGATIAMPSIRAKDSTYPNERSSARMIGQAIAVPFLLFLFHTINRHLWFIDIGAPGSTPNHQPFMELPDQENKFPDIIKKVRRGLAPLKQKALNDFHDVAEMITVKHKIQSWNLPTLVSWDRASYLVDSPFPPPRALAFRVDTQEIDYVNWHDPLLTHEPSSKSPHRNPLTCNFHSSLIWDLLR